MSGDNIWLDWRNMTDMSHHERTILARLELRARRDGVQAVLTDDQAVIMKLVKMLDAVAAEVPPVPFERLAAWVDSEVS